MISREKPTFFSPATTPLWMKANSGNGEPGEPRVQEDQQTVGGANRTGQRGHPPGPPHADESPCLPRDQEVPPTRRPPPRLVPGRTTTGRPAGDEQDAGPGCPRPVGGGRFRYHLSST